MPKNLRDREPTRAPASEPGLAWQARFAKRHHKAISFPEWALVSDPLQPDQAGEDDPYFVRHMHRWFATHDVAYENYFDYDEGLGGQFALDSGNRKFAIARVLYQHLWGRPVSSASPAD